ncbi:MAG: hypothetical protein ACE5WD_08505 [Candidatus Aminicenantia bacterium]
MEEIEILSWATLDTIKEKAEIVEKIGDLHSEHNLSIFCRIEDDLLELCYSDMDTNCLRRYEDEEEFEKAIEQRKEEAGERPYEEDIVDYAEDLEKDLDLEEDEIDEY